MNILHATFPPVNNFNATVEIYQFFVNRFPTQSERAWLSANANDQWLTNGVMAFSQPWDPTKPVLTVYGCCHAAQLLGYWTNFSLTNFLLDRFNLCYLSNYRIKGDADLSGGLVNSIPDTYRELFLSVLYQTDIFVTHPAYRGTEFSPDHLIPRYRGNSTRRIDFHSPSFGALWPVCHFGDEWVKKLLRHGIKADEIKKSLKLGRTNCDLPARFQLAVDRLSIKDSFVHTKIAPFFLEHYRRRRMFITFNHPSFTLMAMQGAQIEEMLGTASRDKEEHCLGLPWNACGFVPVWPDHEAVTRGLRLEYPDYFPDTDGFYNSEIDRCALEVSR